MTDLGIKINKEFDVIKCFNNYLSEVFEEIKDTRDFKNKIHLHKNFIYWDFLKSLCDSHLKLCVDSLVKTQSLSNEINFDTEQPQRAVSNYLINESTETQLTQKEFYRMIIDSAQHELNLL
jgi:hypothetical protein